MRKFEVKIVGQEMREPIFIELDPSKLLVGNILDLSLNDSSELVVQVLSMESNKSRPTLLNVIERYVHEVREVKRPHVHVKYKQKENSFMIDIVETTIETGQVGVVIPDVVELDYNSVARSLAIKRRNTLATRTTTYDGRVAYIDESYIVEIIEDCDFTWEKVQ